MEISKNKKSPNNFNSIDTILLELKNSINAKETVVFCGAGISLHSGLPKANDLIVYVLKKINVSVDEIHIILKSNLPFEAFIETLSRSSNINRLFDIFNLGEPNTNHFLLAKLAKAKYLKTICTTNFDNMFERALENEGLMRGVDFQVFYKENDLGKINWDDSTINLIKIHGSIEAKDNMAITLQQVANEFFSEPRKRVIEHIFSKGVHKNVLILGYSCSDLFDISPQIEALRENRKKVILLDHHTDKQKINYIVDKKQKNPFKYFSTSSWVLYNTDKLVKALWDIFLPKDDYIFPKSITNNIWKKCVDDWFLETEDIYSEAAKYSIVGNIFYKISKFENSIVYSKQALTIYREIGDKQGEGMVLGNLALAHDNLGYHQKAIQFYEQALTIARETSNKHGEGLTLGNLGNAYNSIHNYQKATQFFEHALSIAKDIGDNQNEGIWISNLALTYYWLNDYQKAISYLKKALKIAQGSGNKQLEGNIYGNLGLVYGSLSDYKKSIEFYKQALKIARDIGDKQNEGKSFGNLGIAHDRLGDYRNAVEFFNQALTISKDIGDKQNEGKGLENLGITYDHLGDCWKAIEFYEQALTIVRDFDDKQEEGNLLGNLGNAYKNLGYIQKAIKFHEQALSIARDFDNRKNEGKGLGNLGIAYDLLGDYQKAIKFYKQALTIARDIDDKQNEGYWLSNLGLVYSNLGDYHNAISYYEQALVIFKPILGNEHPHLKWIQNNLLKAKSLYPAFDSCRGIFALKTPESPDFKGRYF